MSLTSALRITVKIASILKISSRSLSKSLDRLSSKPTFQSDQNQRTHQHPFTRRAFRIVSSSRKNWSKVRSPKRDFRPPASPHVPSSRRRSTSPTPPDLRPPDLDPVRPCPSPPGGCFRQVLEKKTSGKTPKTPPTGGLTHAKSSSSAMDPVGAREGVNRPRPQGGAEEARKNEKNGIPASPGSQKTISQ